MTLARIAKVAWLLTLGLLAFGANAQVQFAGRWIASWTAAGDNTTTYLHIETSGRATGTVLNRTKGTWASLTGTVAANGDVSGSFRYSGRTLTTIRGVLRVAGRNLASDLLISGDSRRQKPTFKPNPFGASTAIPPTLVGTWSGAWSGTFPGTSRAGEIGNAELTFGADGRVTGAFENLSAAVRGTVRGNTTPQGDFYGILIYEGGQQTPVVATFKGSSNAITATFVQDLLNGWVFRAPLSLKRGSLATRDSVERLIGRWKGNWTGNGNRGTADLIVTANGTLSGTVRNTTIRLAGPISGTVRPDGSFSGTLRYPDRTLRIEGVIERWGNGAAGRFSDGRIGGPLVLSRSR